MKVVGVLQARMGSTRLPGKILAPVIDTFPMLAVQAMRLSGADVEWWLATSTDPTDDVTEFWGKELGLKVFRGDVENVLSRFLAISEITNADWIVRATGDDPFMNGEMVTLMIDSLKNVHQDVDLLCDLPSARQFPLGFLPELVRSTALKRIDKEITESNAFHRSHVTSFLITQSCEAFRVESFKSRPNWRWTVDTIQDLEMARSIFAALGSKWQHARYSQIVELLDSMPDLAVMNAGINKKSIEIG